MLVRKLKQVKETEMNRVKSFDDVCLRRTFATIEELKAGLKWKPQKTLANIFVSQRQFKNIYSGLWSETTSVFLPHIPDYPPIMAISSGFYHLMSASPSSNDLLLALSAAAFSLLVLFTYPIYLAVFIYFFTIFFIWFFLPFSVIFLSFWNFSFL